MPRVLVLDGPRQLRLAEQPMRRLSSGEIRLRGLLSGISHGTELSLYRGTSAFSDRVFDRGLRAFVEPQAGSASAYPVTLGYEMVSEVVETAADTTQVRVGDLVHTGTPHQEETVLDVASSLTATYPLVRLPTRERLERGLFISLAAVALQAVHDAELKLGDAVSVHGLGAIGLLVVQMCTLEGIQNVIAIDPDPRRRELASRFGATHVLDAAAERSLGLRVRDLNGGHGMDVAIEVSGSDRGLQGALGGCGAERHGGGGWVLSGRRGQPPPRRGVPPQPARADCFGWRLGHTQPTRALVGPPSRHGHRYSAALYRLRVASTACLTGPFASPTHRMRTGGSTRTRRQP